MASYSKRRGLQGVDPLRRKLRNMEKVLESGIKPAIKQAAASIEASAKAYAPKDTGELMRAIKSKVSGDGMSAVIGPYANAAIVNSVVKGTAFNNKGGGVLTELDKKKKFQFFKGYWIEFGTKGAPDRNIPAQPARPFMQPAFDANKAEAVANVKNLVNAQLKNIEGLT